MTNEESRAEIVRLYAEGDRLLRAAMNGERPMTNERPYPELLSSEEAKELLSIAENLWTDIQEDELGGYSGVNRPIYIINSFKAVIEQFGRRDVGQHWSKNQLDAHPEKPK